MSQAAPDGVFLYWLPLGAGGTFVRMNGKAYEFFVAHRQRRRPRDLYHTALQVVVPEGRYVIENAWPIPDGNTAARGVTVEGPVWAPSLRHFRAFRYEVRRWRDGTIADVSDAMGGAHRVTDHLGHARALLELAGAVPAYTWGRDLLHIGDMWNSNSVISWLLTCAGIDATRIEPPVNGRAPGWMTGILMAERTQRAATTLW